MRRPGADNDPAGNPTVNRKKSPKSKSAEAETTEATTDLFYRNELVTIRSAIPWRPLMADAHGRNIHPRPTIRGNLTARGWKMCFFRIAGLAFRGLVMLPAFRLVGDTSGD